MPTPVKARTVYTPSRSYLDNERATVTLGSEPDQFAPYDLLLGALSACFYSTLSDVLEKKRMPLERVEILLSGEKRDAIPQLLQWVHMEIHVYGEVDQTQFEKAVKLAAKYCSIHETIKQVAHMEHTIFCHHKE